MRCPPSPVESTFKVAVPKPLITFALDGVTLHVYFRGAVPVYETSAV
jgi:hypothetical protein